MICHVCGCPLAHETSRAAGLCGPHQKSVHDAALDLFDALEPLVAEGAPANATASESVRLVVLAGEIHRARAAIAKARGKK